MELIAANARNTGENIFQKYYLPAKFFNFVECLVFLVGCGRDIFIVLSVVFVHSIIFWRSSDKLAFQTQNAQHSFNERP